MLSSIDRKFACRNMGTAQRTCWLAAGLLAAAISVSAGSAASYRKRLEVYIDGNERRDRCLTDFVRRLGSASPPDKTVVDPVISTPTICA